MSCDDQRFAALYVFTLMVFSVVSFAASYAENEPEHITNGADALFFQYRLLIRDMLNRRCIFTPSCSQYGQMAIAEKGPIFGVMLALERWTRCHSSASDYDYYVPHELGHSLCDSLSTDEGNVIWDSLLLPF